MAVAVVIMLVMMVVMMMYVMVVMMTKLMTPLVTSGLPHLPPGADQRPQRGVAASPQRRVVPELVQPKRQAKGLVRSLLHQHPQQARLYI
jgi:hypothetical protein